MAAAVATSPADYIGLSATLPRSAISQRVKFCRPNYWTVRIAPDTSAPLGCCKAPDRGAARLKTRAHNAGRALCPSLRNSGWDRERQALSGRDEIDHALTVARAQLLETIATGRALTAMP
jgi:hypothetical protein